MTEPANQEQYDTDTQDADERGKALASLDDWKNSDPGRWLVCDE